MDVIGNQPFLAFVEQRQRDEEYQFETFELGKDRLVIAKIFPDPDKAERDIAIPVLSPILQQAHGQGSSPRRGSDATGT